MSRKIDRDKSTLKLVAVVSAAAILASAFALATTGSFAGLIAYGQQGQNQTNGASNQTIGTAADNETTTASATLAAFGSDCTPVMTAENTTTSTAASMGQKNSSSSMSSNTTVSSNDTTSAATGSNASMSSGMNNTTSTATSDLNDTQIATLSALIEDACDAIRHDKSVTALGLLDGALDILNEAETSTAGVTDDSEDQDATNEDSEIVQSQDDGTETGTSGNTNGGY